VLVTVACKDIEYVTFVVNECGKLARTCPCRDIATYVKNWGKFKVFTSCSLTNMNEPAAGGTVPAREAYANPY
jgi:hypothetical protein